MRARGPILGLILAAGAALAVPTFGADTPSGPLNGARAELAREIAKYGATPDEAAARVRAMSEADVEQAVAVLNPLPAATGMAAAGATLAALGGVAWFATRRRFTGRPVR